MMMQFPTFPTHVPPGTTMLGTPEILPAQPEREFSPQVAPATPAAPCRWPLTVMGLSTLLLAGWLIFRSDAPVKPRIEPPPANYSAMTAQQLAQDAGVPAAIELARRIASRNPQEQVAAAQVMADCRNPRLARNLAMAMTLQQQKTRQEIIRQVQREQMSEDSQARAQSPGTAEQEDAR